MVKLSVSQNLVRFRHKNSLVQEKINFGLKCLVLSPQSWLENILMSKTGFLCLENIKMFHLNHTAGKCCVGYLNYLVESVSPLVLLTLVSYTDLLLCSHFIEAWWIIKMFRWCIWEAQTESICCLQKCTTTTFYSSNWGRTDLLNRLISLCKHLYWLSTSSP